MRCQRCGFEIEPGQTFCSMCGTEQAKAMREKKSKKSIKSIFGVIKVTSNNHLKMWGNFALTLGIGLYILLGRKGENLQLPYLCMSLLLFLYTFFQCLVPYKNPNASKSKKYKLGVSVVFILNIILLLLVVLSGGGGLLSCARKI